MLAHWFIIGVLCSPLRLHLRSGALPCMHREVLRCRPSISDYSLSEGLSWLWTGPVEPARSRPGEMCPDEDLVSQLLVGFRLCLELCRDANAK
jgi:hypothetical protein